MDFNNKIAKFLNQKLNHGNLHQLYLVEPNYRDSNDFSFEWLLSTLTNTISNNPSKNNILNHQDILVLRPESGHKQYNPQQLATFFKFSNSESLILNQKLAIISDYYYLSLNQQNKLLKLLEEPPIKLSVFLINPKKVKVIPTLESRSSKIRLVNPKEGHPAIVKRFRQGFQNFHDFDKYITTQKLSIEEIIESSIDFIELKNLDLQKTMDLKKLFQSLIEDQIFNNSSQSMKLKIYDAIHQ